MKYNVLTQVTWLLLFTQECYDLDSGIIWALLYHYYKTYSGYVCWQIGERFVCYIRNKAVRSLNVINLALYCG